MKYRTIRTSSPASVTIDGAANVGLQYEEIKNTWRGSRLLTFEVTLPFFDKSTRGGTRGRERGGRVNSSGGTAAAAKAERGREREGGRTSKKTAEREHYHWND